MDLRREVRRLGLAGLLLALSVFIAVMARGTSGAPGVSGLIALMSGVLCFTTALKIDVEIRKNKK